MNSEQINLVQASFRDVRPIAGTVAALFYRRLFDLDPSLRLLVGEDLAQQGRVLMAMLSSTVNRLADAESLVPALREIGARCAERGVRAVHYTLAGDAMLWTLRQSLADKLTPAAADAWAVAYARLSQVMKEAQGATRLQATA